MVAYGSCMTVHAGAGGTGLAAGLRVLVVEDDQRIADQLLRVLGRSGYRAERVQTGREALRYNRPDVVLLDLGLPDTDGVQVCRELRQRGDTAIIVVTAYGEEADRVAALDAGADDYLVKPFGVSELLARIRAVLRRVRPGGETIRHGPLTVGPCAVALAAAVLAAGAWALGRRADRVNVIDTLWSLGFGLLAVVTLAIAQLSGAGSSLRQALLAGRGRLPDRDHVRSRGRCPAEPVQG
jgi:DNA-binding response OmpR family regulator